MTAARAPQETGVASMIWLRSLAFSVLFWLWTAALYLPCLVFLAPGVPQRWVRRAGLLWIRGVMALLRWVAGIDFELRGRENLPEGACLIASKHQSAWDTLVFPLLVDEPSYVMKQELLQVPVFGWYMRRYGMVAIDRAGGAKALRRMVAESRQILDAGRKLVIFPEGTRVPPGETRLYHPGVAALYRELGVPAVPVALTSGRHWGRRAFLKRPGTIYLEILPPIPPGLDRRTFMDRLARDLEGASERLLARSEAGPAPERDRAA